MHYARAHIELDRDRQHSLHVNSNYSSPKQEPVSELNSSVNSQRVIAGRDLENSLLKGRRSRLKQYTSLQSYYDHSLNDQ